MSVGRRELRFTAARLRLAVHIATRRYPVLPADTGVESCCWHVKGGLRVELEGSLGSPFNQAQGRTCGQKKSELNRLRRWRMVDPLYHVQHCTGSYNAVLSPRGEGTASDAILAYDSDDV